jgi:hypothetical protein
MPPSFAFNSPLTVFLGRLASPDFQDAMREQLRVKAAAVNTFLSYRDGQGRHIHEYPAMREKYEMLPTTPHTRRLLAAE